MVRIIAVILVVIMIASLFIGGAQPEAAGLFPAPWDKLVHVIFFFVLALLPAQFVGLPISLVIVLTLTVGVADELHQSFLPGRVAGWDDLLADAVGIGLSLVLVKFKSYRKVRLKETVSEF